MWTLQDAKNKFSAVVDGALAGHPQAVTRRGKPAVVVVAASEYERLVKAATDVRPSFLDQLATFPECPPGFEFERIDVKLRDIKL